MLYAFLLNHLTLFAILPLIILLGNIRKVGLGRLLDCPLISNSATTLLS